MRHLVLGVGKPDQRQRFVGTAPEFDLLVSAGRDQAAKSYRLLRAILNTAVDDELIVRNPCRIRGGGSERADERPMIDSALVFMLADSISARLRALVIVAGFVGLRTGELLGLRRCDVDLDNARLTVLVQAQQVCAVMDGAAWRQGLVDVQRPDAVRILDFPHAAEHLALLRSRLEAAHK